MRTFGRLSILFANQTQQLFWPQSIRNSDTLVVHHQNHLIEIQNSNSSLQGIRTNASQTDFPSATISAAIVLLAPPRYQKAWETDRFCFLLGALQSIDEHLNQHYGPYPILIITASDYHLEELDGPYSDQDRQLMSQRAPHSPIEFMEIPMYSGPALEVNTTREQIKEWRRGKKGAIAGRDIGYQSMCRLWSGRIQKILWETKGLEYYMRMDDDSYLTKKLSFDPFQRMREKSLVYSYRRAFNDQWGISHLWRVTLPYLQNNLEATLETGMTTRNARGEIVYSGTQPYNNFHIAQTRPWLERPWRDLWADMEKEHLWFRYRVGDANVHAMLLCFLQPQEYEKWSDFPYAHNSNDDRQWARKALEWRQQCRTSSSNNV